MDIIIVSINKDDVFLIGDNKTLCYSCKFTCPLVSGDAFIVPYTNSEDKLVSGVKISVETAQESVSNFKIESPKINQSITALPQSRDYRIIGTTVLNTGNIVFDIDVGNFSFAVDNEETNGIIPKIGDNVSFTIHGLSLWDSNIR